MAKVGTILMAIGNLFHILAPVTRNAQSPLCLDLILDSDRCARSLDLSDLEET